MNELEQAFSDIRKNVSDPKAGLGESVFQFISTLTPMVNVDLWIKNAAGEVLLTWRSDDFYGPGWHIPGGILRFKEEFAKRVTAVAKQELGTTVNFDNSPKVIQQVMHSDRDIRGHFVSLLFDCSLNDPPDDRKQYVVGRPQHGQWSWHDHPPASLIKVHKNIYGNLFPKNKNEFT